MKHEQIREALQALRDKELEPASQKEVLAHLNACVECRQEFAFLERITGKFFAAQRTPTSSETELFVQRVMARLQPEAYAPVGWWPWIEENFMVPVLGMSLAAALFSILMLKPESVGPTDTLLLLNSESHAVGQWVLPPDPSSHGILLFESEEQ